ncbi:hypothetical protein MTYP_01118 [Methylophilaceae bacterium]|nr:hypothetical protein MTYP_01118 [Methylophilaceae bacterium]
MIYPEFPLAQHIKLTSSRPRMDCARQFTDIVSLTELMALETSEDGFLMLARNEESLTRPMQVLQKTLDDKLELSPLQIRYMRVGNMLYEPNMHLRVSVNSSYIDKVRNDFQVRKFKIIEDYKTISGFVLRAEMPLRLIMGYGMVLASLSEYSGFHLSWLHGYTPYLDITI